MPEKRRKNELNLLNVFLSFLVIFIHASSAPVVQANRQTLAFGGIYVLWKLASVAVPGFIFVSAAKLALGFASEKQTGGYGAFILKKIRGIWLPYAAYVLLYYLYFWHKQYFPFEWRALFSYIFIGDLAAHFYFVVIIMQFYFLVPLWKAILKRVNTAVFLLLSMLVMLVLGQFLPDILQVLTNGFAPFAYNDRVFTTYLFYYSLGLAAGWNYEAFCKVLKENKGVLLGAALSFAALNCAMGYMSFKNGLYAPYAEVLQVSYCSTMILFLFLTAKQLDKAFPRVFQSRLFKLVNRSTYPVYLLHVLIMLVVDEALQKANITGIGASFVIRLAATFVLSFGICCLYRWIKECVKKRAFF